MWSNGSSALPLTEGYRKASPAREELVPTRASRLSVQLPPALHSFRPVHSRCQRHLLRAGLPTLPHPLVSPVQDQEATGLLQERSGNRTPTAAKCDDGPANVLQILSLFQSDTSDGCAGSGNSP